MIVETDEAVSKTVGASVPVLNAVACVELVDSADLVVVVICKVVEVTTFD